jgi:hypothetical protein
VHRTGVYSVGVGPEGPALERFPNIQKKKKKKTYLDTKELCFFSSHILVNKRDCVKKIAIIPKVYNNNENDDKSYKFASTGNSISEERSNIIPEKP